MTLFQLLLILHILAVLIGFGPTFAFPLIARLGQKNPQHARFAVELTDFIAQRLTIPLMVIVPFLGLGLIWTGNYDLWRSEWLVVSIGIYTVLFFYAVLVQNPLGAKMLKAMEEAPSAPSAEAGAPLELAAMGRKAALGGLFMTLAIIAIVVLMVWRPGADFVAP